MSAIRMLVTVSLLIGTSAPVTAQSAGTATPGASSTSTVIAPHHPLDGKLLVYVANGSGSSTSLSDGLGTAAKNAGLTMAMKPVHWCRNTYAIRDHADHVNQLAAAKALAHEVLALKGQCPNARIVLMGHSSGGRVILAAAEALPQKTLERIVLLASSVNSYYDVRRALASSRLGIDSFHSIHDGILDLMGETFGTADGKLTSMAGVTGFALPYVVRDPDGFQGLRQYPWNRVLGTNGSHYSWTDPTFLHRFVLPMLATP